jgi:hypothetical protein
MCGLLPLDCHLTNGGDWYTGTEIFSCALPKQVFFKS